MNRTCVITGATSGIGYETAKYLALENFQIIIIGRNSESGQKTVEKLIKTTGNNLISFILADLSSKEMIIEACKQLRQQIDKLDVLINNAAYISSRREENKDGIELQMAVNHYAPLILIHELIPLLIKSEQARIIHVSSRAHSRGKIWWDDINLIKNYTLSRSYNQSKLANLMCTHKISQLFKDIPITINSYHPGLVNTEIGEKHTTLIERYAWKIIKLIGRSPKIAARDAVYLATDPKLKTITGGYFHNQKQILPSKKSKNNVDIELIWSHSCLIAGLDFNYNLISKI